MSSVHIPYQTTNNKWFEYEQQWKIACLNLLNKHIPTEQRSATRVLDFGCGRGEFLRLLREDHYQCEGVDFDPECVRLSSQYAPAQLANEQDLLESFKGRTFDVVSVIHVLEHLRDPAKLVETLKGLSSRYLLLAVPNLQSTVMISARGETYTANAGHVCGWDYAHFRNFITNICGLKLLAFEPDTVPFTTKFVRIDQLFERLFPRQIIRKWETGFLLKRFPYLSNTVIALCEQ